MMDKAGDHVYATAFGNYKQNMISIDKHVTREELSPYWSLGNTVRWIARFNRQVTHQLNHISPIADIVFKLAYTIPSLTEKEICPAWILLLIDFTRHFCRFLKK